MKYALFGAVMFVCCYVTGLFLPDNKIWSIAVMVIVGMIVYMGELIITKDAMIQMGVEIFKSRKPKKA